MDWRTLSCEIKKWKFPQNDASKYQLLLVSSICAIDFYNQPTHDWRLFWHHSRKEIRLMRGFETTNFFPTFFLVLKLDAKEIESTRIQ